MDKWMVFEQALDLAIDQEQAAADFYVKIAECASAETMRKIFNGSARDERAHKAKLEFIKATGEINSIAKQLTGLKEADYSKSLLPPYELDYRDALILAMNKEKMAFKLYSAFAAKAPNDALRNVFTTLALEEASHKLRFEIAYDDLVGQEEAKIPPP
jgi:rubrerythrin